MFVFDGKKIQKMRKHFCITQKQLAERLNISQCTISEYENGKSIPSLENLYNLALALHVSIDYLLGVTNNQEAVQSSLDLTEMERDFLTIYQWLPVEKRERAIGILIGLRDG